MDKMLLWVSVLTIFLETFAQTDLKEKVFVFPRESASDHVSLITKLEEPLQNFTLCLRAYSDLSRPYSLFSYNTQGKDNELLLYKEKVGEYSLYIGGSKVTAKVTEEFPAPVHICTSWESSSGIAEFWVNEKPLVKKGLKKGYSVASQPKIIMGQEQDAYGGKFDRSQSFVGEIGDLYMWNSVLSPEEIQSVYEGSPLNANILDWQKLNYELKGYVIIKPRVWA
ncbi:Serum amyloid P-component [Heterocephalus glaber]|uniref:Pentraxin family member n=1 Tax=Heterocephalus glaber TaxID=10181 RepID=G5BWM2_HETGA|nr:serum amyloid P-component [Heterocephalus glaber]EHB13683.1 Serum amyloid P-component [Heterocephalus glaber]